MVEQLGTTIETHKVSASRVPPRLPTVQHACPAQGSCSRIRRMAHLSHHEENPACQVSPQVFGELSTCFDCGSETSDSSSTAVFRHPSLLIAQTTLPEMAETTLNGVAMLPVPLTLTLLLLYRRLSERRRCARRQGTWRIALPPTPSSPWTWSVCSISTGDGMSASLESSRSTVRSWGCRHPHAYEVLAGSCEYETELALLTDSTSAGGVKRACFRASRVSRCM